MPVLGWVPGLLLQTIRIERAIEYLREQLSERTADAELMWTDERQRRVAAAITQCCIQAGLWGSAYFLPNDPFEIVIRWNTGDICELDALFRIEKAFDIKLAGDIRSRMLAMTFGEFVDYVISQSALQLV